MGGFLNPQKIAILTDSCADIPPEYLQKYPIFVLPLRIIFGDRCYADGVDITPAELYRRLPAEIPKTSLPDGQTVLDTFARIRLAGYEKVAAIIFSSGLSGTYQLVRRMGEEQKGLTVQTFDTLSGCLGTGAVALQAAESAERGMQWETLLLTIPRLIRNTSVYFCIDTLEYLRKGGRIGKITAVAGTMLQIKPIITFSSEGELVNIAKVRGRQQSIQKLVELIGRLAAQSGRYNIMLAHGDCPEEAKKLKELLLKAAPNYVSCFEGVVDCTLGAHVGPHLLGAGIQILDR